MMCDGCSGACAFDCTALVNTTEALRLWPCAVPSMHKATSLYAHADAHGCLCGGVAAGCLAYCIANMPHTGTHRTIKECKTSAQLRELERQPPIKTARRQLLARACHINHTQQRPRDQAGIRQYSKACASLLLPLLPLPLQRHEGVLQQLCGCGPLGWVHGQAQVQEGTRVV